MEFDQNKPRPLVERAVIIKDPQKAITEYYKSKLEEETIKKYPDWDIAQCGPEIELLKARRELAQAEHALDSERQEYIEKRQHMDQQWAEMRRKQTQLRESFIKFDQFVKENRQKRERAERKIKEEVALQEKYRSEIDELEKKLEYLTSIRDQMKDYIERHKGAQDFLESVVNESEEFNSITDIFNRFDSLMEARETIAKQHDEALQRLEEMGLKMQRMAEEKEEKFLELNKALAELHKEYDKSKSEALKWENVVSRIKKASSEKVLEIVRIQSICWSLYTQMCKRKGVPIKVHKDDIENQLVEIKRTYLVLKDIVKNAQEMALKEKSAKKNKK